jgi:hypothetical protein
MHYLKILRYPIGNICWPKPSNEIVRRKFWGKA